jgi:putative nucleotidyltransferase with HDIG domain
MLKDLEKTIRPLYMVGGSVRDEIMGLMPVDFDFATPLSPEEIETAIRDSGRRPYLVGKKFGTVGVKIEGQMIEITTFRTEKYIAGSRKPEVQFVRDINVDLSRRDFTINAIAKRDGRYIDPFGGINDIKHKVIRAVGNPTERFKEDPLRMLRAVRFAVQLKFTIETVTERKIKKLAYKILDISKERWMIEMDKILISDQPSIGLNLLMEKRLINFMIPELSVQYRYDQNSPYHKLHLWDHSLKTVDLSPRDVNIRWAALLHDIGKPFTRTDRKDRSNYVHHELVGREIVKKIGHYLKWPKERIEIVSDLVGGHLKDSALMEADDLAKE